MISRRESMPTMLASRNNKSRSYKERMLEKLVSSDYNQEGKGTRKIRSKGSKSFSSRNCNVRRVMVPKNCE